MLHILNGDSSLELFNETNLPGKTMVWREMLSEGKSDRHVGSDLFWKNRKQHLHKEMKVPSSGYLSKVISEFHKLNSLKEFDEIVLWFEYDLFCQVNLMAALSLLLQVIDKEKVSLICVGKFPESERLLALGQLNPTTFESLFDQRITLTKEDMIFADKVWEIYSSEKHENLKEVIKTCPSKFEYLPAALLAHLNRFPNHKNGLNAIETEIMKLIHHRSGNVGFDEIIKKILTEDQIYGLGDMIYMGYINKLSPLYRVIDDQLSINDRGIAVLHNELNFEGFREDYHFGGASIKKLL